MVTDLRTARNFSIEVTRHVQNTCDGHWIFLASCLIAIANNHVTLPTAVADKHTYTQRTK